MINSEGLEEWDNLERTGPRISEASARVYVRVYHGESVFASVDVLYKQMQSYLKGAAN